jgi:hypothetical protein
MEFLLMNSRIIFSLALGCVAVSALSMMAQPGRRGEPQAGRFGWLSSLEQGEARARQNGKPLMVVVRCVP